jgi:hypothetical protein
MVKKIILFGSLFDLLLAAYGIFVFGLVPTLSGIDFVFLGLLIISIGFYLAASLSNWIKIDAGLDQPGLLFGIVIGGLWVVELLTGNIGNMSSIWISLLYRGSILMVFLASIGAGLVGTLRKGELSDGIKVGLLAGMLSSLITFTSGLSIAYSFMGHLDQDPQTLQEFTRSGAQNLPAFIVKDMLGAMTSHLWIGIILGLLCGLAGGLIAKGKALVLPKIGPQA